MLVVQLNFNSIINNNYKTMKFIKATTYGVFKKDELTKRDLLDVRENDANLINLDNETYFNGEENKWEDLKEV